LTFDSNGVITGASNNAVSVANTAITGNIISSQITSVANTQITGNIASSQITSNPTLYGNVSVTGVIAVGGATPTTNGSGITFPATQSASTGANTLDDYEEGTFTPTVFLGATSNSIGTATGTYTKIGNVVFFACRAENITKAGTGNLTMGGLPFASSSAGDQNKYSQFLIRWTGINSGGVIIALVSIGNAVAEFQTFTTTGGYSGAVSDGSISASYSIYGVSGHYYTNT